MYSTRQENSEKNSKKIEKITKPLSEIIFSQNGNEIGRKREKKKILIPNSVHTRPRQENFGKNIKKIRKIIKPLPGVIFSQGGMRYNEKEGKTF